jgi:hypothetical protein
MTILKIEQQGINNNNNNSVYLVRERTIPTERPPLVGEVSAKFCGSPMAVISIS